MGVGNETNLNEYATETQTPQGRKQAAEPCDCSTCAVPESEREFCKVVHDKSKALFDASKADNAGPTQRAALAAGEKLVSCGLQLLLAGLNFNPIAAIEAAGDVTAHIFGDTIMSAVCDGDDSGIPVPAGPAN